MSVKNIGAEISRSMFGNNFEAHSGAGAVNPFAGSIALTTTGADALTLANATPGTLLYIYMATDGGAGTLTPDTMTGWTTIVFADAEDSALLCYVDDTIGWVVIAMQIAETPSVLTSPNITTSIDDANGLELFKLTATASAVNEITVANAAANGDPSLTASGSDTNIGLVLAGKGSDPVSIGQATSSSVLLVATQPIADENGCNLIEFTATGTAVNEITIANAAADGDPSITASGTDTNIGLVLAGKGTDPVSIGQATSTGVLLVATQPILDENGLELIKFTDTASAVNEITVTNAATTTSPNIAATGGDTNISLELTAKGTGVIASRSPVVEKMTETVETNSTTLTVAELLTKVIDGTPTGAANYTLSTAALLVAGMGPDCAVGDSFEFIINNKAGGAHTITVVAGVGGTADGTLTVAQNVVRSFKVIVTNVTGAAEAYFVYGLGA